MFLGLDLSLNGSGLCLLNKNGDLFFVKKIISNNLGDNIKLRFERYDYICNEIYKSIQKYINDILCISIEMYSYMSNGKIVQLVESGTLVRNMLLKNMNNKCVIKEITPQSLKKFIAGDLKEERKKEIIIKEVYKKFNIDVNDDNEADAIVLAKISKAIYDKYNNIEEFNKLFLYQKEVIDKLK